MSHQARRLPETTIASKTRHNTSEIASSAHCHWRDKRMKSIP
jgi:hypothetical protein